MVNLTGGWNTLWSAISGAIGGQVMAILTIIGVVLVVFAIGKYFFDKRRGGGVTQGLGVVMWTLVFGAILAAPQAIIPLLLTILDLLINTIIAIVGATAA